MDAYDIFVNLTKHAKFTKKKRQQNEETAPIKAPIKIKSEPISKLKTELPESGTNFGGSINLLGDIIATDNAVKFKKKKKTSKTPVGEDVKQERLVRETVNHFRNTHDIHVIGSRIPDPIHTFTQLPITQELIDNLHKCGYHEPTPIQMQAIPVLLQGRNLLACAPTGSGKTAAFLLPIIHELNDAEPDRKAGIRALVVCPTRELAKQTRNECVRLAEGRSLDVIVISSAMVKAQERSKWGVSCDVLVTTPNRLCHLLEMENSSIINLSTVRRVIIDEADRLFDASSTHNFRAQLASILAHCTHPNLATALFSATYTPLVARWCNRSLRQVARISVGVRNSANHLVDQKLVYVGSEAGKLIALRALAREGLRPPVLLFVQSKERAQQLFGELAYDGLCVDAIHADRTQQQRDDTVKAFREGKVWVLICTELMGRGLDFKGVSLVINYDCPTSAVAYVHRVGRAGRAGRRGAAVTFHTDADRPHLRTIAALVRQSGAELPEYMRTLPRTSRTEIRQLRTKQVDREHIKSKFQVNRNTLRKRKPKKEGQDDNRPPMKKQKTHNHTGTIHSIRKNKDKKLSSVKKKIPQKTGKKQIPHNDGKKKKCLNKGKGKVANN